MTKLASVTERAMGMSEAVWERHVNPWSGWTRIPVLPVLGLAIWSRTWIGWWSLVPVALVTAWIYLNPRVFPKPKSVDNWMSQGVLGERIWLANRPGTIADHHRSVIRSLLWISSTGAIAFFVGLAALNLTLTLVGVVTTMLGKLWFLDRMVWLYRDQVSTPTEDPHR